MAPVSCLACERQSQPPWPWQIPSLPFKPWLAPELFLNLLLHTGSTVICRGLVTQAVAGGDTRGCIRKHEGLSAKSGVVARRKKGRTEPQRSGRGRSYGLSVKQARTAAAKHSKRPQGNQEPPLLPLVVVLQLPPESCRPALEPWACAGSFPKAVPAP